MSYTWRNSSRLRSSVNNHDHNPPDQRGTMDDGNDSLMSGEGEDDEDDEEEDGDGDDIGIFKKGLKMPPYEHAKRKLSHLVELMNGPYLDLAPHYQRGVVWTRKAMRLLIDSMWKGYYIPPVIFNLELVEDKKGVVRFKRTCVDGKQRLTSIRDFMNGEFPCWIDQKAWYFCAPPDKRRRGHKINILPDSAKVEFEAIEVLCTEYKGLTERQEIELFQRVQLGKPLTKAEAFRATQGSWQQLAKLYEKEFADVIDLCKHNRASGFRTILVSFMQIYECVDPAAGNGVPILRNSFKSIELFCSNTPALDADTKAHLHYVFEIFHELIEEDRSTFENRNLKNRQVFSPIELIAVACLISQKGAERPKGTLRGDILALRAHLREVHSDIRINKPCWTTAWRFIDTIEHLRGAVDGSTVRKMPPKIVKIRLQPFHSARSYPPEDVVPQARSADVSPPVTTDKDKRRLSNMAVDEQPSNAAGEIPMRNEQRKKSTCLNSPNNPSTTGLPSPVTNEGDHTTSSRRLSNTTASVSSRMSSIALREGSVAERRRPQLSTFTSNLDKSGSERAASQGLTISDSGTPLIPSTMSPIFGNIAVGPGSMTAPPSRKRIALDLGSGGWATHELESKKARLMARHVKQEKDG